MTGVIPDEIAGQVAQARGVLAEHLRPTLRAVHLFGSALDGGLKPQSDIDLLVTVGAPLDEAVRKALPLDLLSVSAPPGYARSLRPLEVTVVSLGEIVPWRHPARRELQFGEWLRRDLSSGVFDAPVVDADLAILLTKARQHSVALVGPRADALFEPVPAADFSKALAETLMQWRSPTDWAGDERNVVLTLARIWYSAATGRIAPKDVAASWVLEHLPIEHHSLLRAAQQAYVTGTEDDLAARAEETLGFILFAKATAAALLDATRA